MQSSIGGPLLWPAEEPWRTCASTSHAGEVPLVAVLQLYARDIPALPHPEGADLLQILWCPLDEDDALGKPLLLRRDAAAVGTRLDPAPPSLPETGGDYVLRPCVLDPETVTEYPYEDAPEDLLDGGIQEAANHDETAEANRHPLGVTFADNGVSYIFACTHCPDMPLESWYDSY
jgi:hypothetical protein